MNFNCKTKVTKLTLHRKLNSQPAAFTILSPKIGIDFKHPVDKPFGLFYLITTAEGDDEFGGTLEIEVQSLTAIDNKRKRPDEKLLFNAAINSMNETNKEFTKEYMKMGFVFSKPLASFSEDFSETDLKAGIKKLLDDIFPK